MAEAQWKDQGNEAANAEYMAAFGDDMRAAADPEEAVDGGAPRTGGEPAAGGMDVDAAASGSPEAAPAAAPAPAAEDAGAAAPAPAAPPAPAGENSAAEDAAEGDVNGDKPMTAQQLKSWEGRLRAREAQLKGASATPAGKEAEAVSEKIEAAAASAPTTQDTAAIEQIADAVESGEMTAEEAKRALAEDYGEDFVKMLVLVASSEAATVAKTAAKSSVDEAAKPIIESITDDRQRRHFEAIYDAHPDFVDIKDSPEFEAFKKSYENGDAIAERGTARQINKMLSDFKAQAKPASEPNAPSPVKAASKQSGPEDSAVSAAEGVRSAGGMTLPAEPGASGSYAEEWARL